MKTNTYYGRGGEIRTPDPLVPNQMRYQAALRPELRFYKAIALVYNYIINHISN